MTVVWFWKETSMGKHEIIDMALQLKAEERCEIAETGFRPHRAA
jgi:hypothetical protein